MIGTQDKTYIFRKYFGFDVQSIIFQFNKILEFEDCELYFYGNELDMLASNALKGIDFYTYGLCNLESIENTFLNFIEDAEEHLREIYETASDTLRKQLETSLATNTKQLVKEEFALGVVRNAFADED